MQYAFFIILAPMTALAVLGISAYARWRYPSRQSASLVWLNVPTTGWLLANTLELINPTEAGTFFWSKVTYSFIAFTAVAWLAFCLRYTEHTHWLNVRRMGWFFIVPTFTLAVLWLPGLDHWMWTAKQFTPILGMLAINVDYGPYFWVHSGYSYAMIIAGAVLIIRQYLRSFRLFRQMSSWLVLGVLFPLLVNAAYIGRLIPEWRKDYTAISFGLAVLAFAIGIYRYHLFELHPVARDILVTNLPDAMLVLDPQNRVVDYNPAAQTLLKLPEEVIGEPASQVLAAWPNALETLRSQNSGRDEIAIEQDGKDRFLDLQVSPLPGYRGGRSKGTLMVARDVTLRRHAEMALRQHAQELEASNAELDAFSHTVAHDLKNPLASIMAAADLLHDRLDQLPPEESQRMLNIVVNNTRKMGNIIDELLLLASVRKLSEITIVPLDMPRLVNGALERLAMTRLEHNAEIVCVDQWPRSLGYAPWVEEIWMNYISNAIKYGGTPPRVELGADIVQDGHLPVVRYWVRDNGPGVPREAQQRIFRPFNRLDVQRSEGHGLGLSIVLRIVEKLGGQAGIDSELGQGSTFWFTLPAIYRRDE